MGQAIGETIFDILYLTLAIVLGLRMWRLGRSATVRTAGLMTFLLGAGDAFHLIPRAWALWTDGLAANAAALGVGKLITSITMTFFYLLLYRVWRLYFQKGKQPVLTGALFLLALIRIVLCALPANEWLSADPPLLWGILRNIPFLLMGVLILLLYLEENKRENPYANPFRFMPLAIGLSFAFYIPVVLLSGTFPIVGVLMIPKTLAYVWIILMCWRLHRTEPEKKRRVR